MVAVAFHAIDDSEKDDCEVTPFEQRFEGGTGDAVDQATENDDGHKRADYRKAA